MQNYMVVRWVPNPARGEYVNVGILVWDDQDPDGVIYKEGDFQRANRLGQTPEDLPPVITMMLEKMWVCSPTSRNKLAQKMRHHHRNVIQFSEVMPMAGRSLQWCADMLYEKLVAD